MTGAEQDLPGLDLAQIVHQSEDIADLSGEKHYTAERLLVSYPDRYRIARGLFFDLGLSKRAICEICHLNARTLNALIERELNARGEEFLYKKVRRKKALITYQLIEQLEELATDPIACEKAGINGLIQAIKLIQESTGHTIDANPSSNGSASVDGSSVEYARIYRMTNGLDARKNPAAASDVEDECPAKADECHDATDECNDAVDKCDGKVDNHSISQNNSYANLQGISPCVDKFMDKDGGSGKNGSDKKDIDAESI